MSDNLLRLLRAHLDPANVVSGDELTPEACADAGGYARTPAVCVKPRTTLEVSMLLTMANTHGFAVTPRGAGTGLSGGCVPGEGGVLLDLSAMDRIKEVSAEDMLAVVEPGVTTRALRDAAAKLNLFYPPDPASLATSTLGGNAATNAGGPACVKYGVTKHYVLGLEAVLPTGEIVRLGGRTRKNVVGYDLASLMVGSEGTLGVITELTLKLIPLPPSTGTMIAVFPDLSAAMRAVSAIMSRSVTPSALEFLDRRCLALIGELLPVSGLEPTDTLLLLEADGFPETVSRELAIMRGSCREFGASRVHVAEEEAERAELWEARRQVSVRIHERYAVYVPEDVVVPLSKISELTARLPEVEARHGVSVYAFGHSGDGNIHLNIVAEEAEKRPAVDAAVLELLGLTVSLGGCLSGEHGIGQAKCAYLGLNLSEEVLRAQTALKKGLDPTNILNPGKKSPL